MTTTRAPPRHGRDRQCANWLSPGASRIRAGMDDSAGCPATARGSVAARDRAGVTLEARAVERPSDGAAELGDEQSAIRLERHRRDEVLALADRERVAQARPRFDVPHGRGRVPRADGEQPSVGRDGELGGGPARRDQAGSSVGQAEVDSWAPRRPNERTRLPPASSGPPTGRNILAAFQGLGITNTATGIVLDRLTPIQRRILELLQVQPPWPEQEFLAA